MKGPRQFCGILLWATAGSVVKGLGTSAHATRSASPLSVPFRTFSLASTRPPCHPRQYHRRSTIGSPRSVVRHAHATGDDYSVVDNKDEDFFLRQVETTVQNVLSSLPIEFQEGKDKGKGEGESGTKEKDPILSLPSRTREAVGVARVLKARLDNLRRNNDCPRCWMQRAHCICADCPSIPHTSSSNNSSSHASRHQLGRLFLLMNHKEIGLKVDTAKLLLAAFPHQARLVVGGIGPDYQESMKEMQEAMMMAQEDSSNRCLVLFPDDTAQTYQELVSSSQKEKNDSTTTKEFSNNHHEHDGWDLIVLDGTWAQARKLHLRYIPSRNEGGPRRVQLSTDAVAMLASSQETPITDNEDTDDYNSKDNHNRGHQLRRHPIAWRQVGTFEATRLFLRDLHQVHEDVSSSSSSPTEPAWKAIEKYQDIANQAARRELGPPRVRQ